MALLDGLHEMDWAQVSHAYGPATDVPELLRALIDPEQASEELRQRARSSGESVRALIQSDLYGNVIHQNTVWSASSNMVPFLVEILRDGPEDKELREFLLEYLANLAGPGPGEVFPGRFDPDEYFADAEDPGTWREQDRGSAQEDDEILDQMTRVWGKACYEAVETALPELMHYLDDADDDLAISAMVLFSAFPRSAARAAPLLRASLTSPSPARVGAALVTLALLDPIPAQKVAEELIVRATNSLVAFHAACAAIIADPRSVSSRAKEVVSAPIDELGRERAFRGTLSHLQDECLTLLRCVG